MREPYQVLVFPYHKSDEGIEYAIFHRSDADYWQGIAGGGEEGETIIESAMREAWEEAELLKDSLYMKLDTVNSMSVEGVVGKFLWGENVYIINEYCYGVKIINKELKLSNEHTEYKWLNYDDAISLLKWDGNKTALWELNKRLIRQLNY
ncbi:NUDIX domain-containing protein [Clostridium pasteurianum]|uniref:NTP pyrophosphohydrolase n=1 Tax=Clostridium pasteurianum BC1 TaxID=86416 RepID=R4K8X2_CLOPA|nr:NUDIX domain-containing protein [Clostridium pasteurianum]AGK96075.1 NTP pyrophosphohydrolase [Clostridium pasteurianum BC1]